MKARKLIVLLLTLVLIVSLCPIGAFAATADNVKQYGKVDENGYGGYLAIGSSISRGVGAKSIDECNDLTLRNVDGGYTYTIAKAVGCTCPTLMTDPGATYWPCCFNGLGVAAVMDLMGIEDNYYDTEYVHHPKDEVYFNRYAETMVPYFGCPESVDGTGADGVVGNIRTLVSNASLITVELGMQEMLNRPYTIATTECKDTLELAGRLVSELYEGFDYWVEWYPVLIKNMKEMNPNATVVLVGAMNVVADVDIIDGFPTPVGVAISSINMLMNQYYRQWAKEYGCIYVDITNAETASTTYDWAVMGDMFMPNDALATHPTYDGHQYIARQILAVLEEVTPVQTVDAKKNIVVDLERFTDVDYVMLDGKLVKNYSMNGYELIIPVRSHNAKNLTIGVIQDGSKVAVTTYQLSYDKNDGYTAYRIYGVNDATGTLIKTVKKIVTTSFSLFKNIANLFKF